MITAVVVDDGEPNLERCLRSLRDQTVKPFITLCGGPNTDYKLARSLADKVLGPIIGIGKARVKGILEAETDYILSCDSDTIYSPHYAEYALEDLRSVRAVKAGVILPHEWNHPLVPLETVLSFIPPYEFAFAFRRQAFLDANIQMDDYSQPRRDIGVAVVARLHAWPDYRMICYTRMPTRGALECSEKYLLSAVAGATPILAAATIPLAVSASRIISKD